MCECVCWSLYTSDCHLEVIVVLHSNTVVKCFSLVKGKVPYIQSGHGCIPSAHPQTELLLHFHHSAQPPRPLSNSVIIQLPGLRVCECDL